MLNAVLPALLASALLAGFAAWIYVRRELPIPGRGRLAALRAAVLVLLVVMLVDPAVPSRGVRGGGAWVILDGSRSMEATTDDGTPWSRALARTRELRVGAAGVLLLGDPPRALEDSADLETLDDVSAVAGPGEPSSRLAPALRQAAEAGASRVTVVTDLRLDDDVAAAAAARRLGLPVTFDDVGGPVRSAGIARVEASAAGRAGDEIEVAVEVFATEGAASDSVSLTLFRDDEPVASWPLELPGAGARVRRVYTTALPDQAGPVFWRAEVALPGDGFPDDDARTRVTEVDPASGLVALVALQPDWEPRFLLPVLAGVTGLPVRGWLRVGPDRFLPMEGGEPVDGAQLRPVLQDARILVLQGRGRGAPDWIGRVAGNAGRVLTLASDEAGAAAAGVAAAPARPGEWYVRAPPPPSPLVGALAELAVSQLPPLTRVLPAATADAGSGRPALMLQGPGGAITAPALVLIDQDTRREVVALASGFWRWAFRPGDARDAYRSVWSGVAGWLLALDEGRSLGGVAPEATVVSTRRPVTWRAPLAAGGLLEVTTARGEDTPRVDTLAVGQGGIALQPAVPEGRLAWRARILSPDSVAERERTWTGTLEAERWSGDLLPPRTGLAFELEAGRPTVAGRESVPLRTRPWPYLLLLALLSLEWFGRRRRGLR